MVLSKLNHNIAFQRTILRTVATFQVVVLLILAVPVCCYEIKPVHDKAGIVQAADAASMDRDVCPCCPDENTGDSEDHGCSTCSYCSCQALLLPVVITKYEPSTTPLIATEQFTKLADVHIPIFVPPQNLV